MIDEAVALKIHPCQPVGTLRIPARNAHEVVCHAERIGVRRRTVCDDDRYRPQHELTEHHVMDDAPAVAEITFAQASGEFLRSERIERPIVNRDPGQCARDRFEQIRLHVGEAVLWRHRRRDPTRDQRHFFDVEVIDTRKGIEVHATILSLKRARSSTPVDHDGAGSPGHGAAVGLPRQGRGSMGDLSKCLSRD